MGHWIVFFLEVVKKHATEAVGLLDQGQRTESYLSDRQRAVWDTLQKNELLSRSEIYTIIGMLSATVRQALVKLMNMGQVESAGEGGATKYKVKKNDS